MMTNFTNRAQRVMQLATEEAHRVSRQTIAAEHILLGLCKEGTGMGASVLAHFCNGDLSNIVQRVEQFMEAGSKTVASDKLPFNDEAETVLTLAAEESQHLNHNWLGTEHLLLGLCRCPEGVVARVFQQVGTSQDEVREETLTILGEMSPKVSERHVAQSIRQAITLCWEMLPSDKKTLHELQSVTGRIVEQEIADFKAANPSIDKDDRQ
jgi:ATP-dependent Clp protease ATP-binding subunit ClpA